ncbi:MAG: hypothetical protein JOZ72_08000 [Alphaproteobacteria bacterium]|nr:hypothetical protein [Alphaproteobacteria bacterium]
MFDRRSFLAGASATALCGPALGQPPLGVPAPGRRYAFDAAAFPRYDLDVAIDRAAQTLAAEAAITVPRPLVRDGMIVFALAEDAKDLVVKVDGAAAPPTPVKDPNTPAALRRWQVAAAAGEGAVRVEISYRLVAAIGPVFAIKPDGAVASGTAFAWYPQIERADHVRLEGTGRVRIVSGADVVVAGGVAGPDGAVTVDEPRYFEFAAAPYRIVDSRKGRARLYLLRDHPNTAVFAERLDRLIAVLERHFGPLPSARFDLAEAPPLAARQGGFDGASLDGFMLAVGFYFDQPFNTAFFGHEISHQWWGGLVRRVGLDGVYMLDECLAQYGSMLAVEDIDGEHAAEIYRRRGFPGYYAEYGGFMYLARTLQGIDAPMTALPASDGFICRRVVNAKGMLVWRMLGDMIGRERLSTFLRGFVRRHAYRRASLADLVTELRALLGGDAWFVDDWFDKAGAVDLSLEWKQTGRMLSLTVRQTAMPKRVRVPVDIRMRGRRPLTKTIFIDGPATTVAMAVAGHVSDVALDPQYRVLRWTPEFHAQAEAIAPYVKGDIALNYGKTAAARAIFEAALPSAGGELQALLERGLGDADANDARNGDAAIHYGKALALAPDHWQVPEVWRALADAYRALDDETKALAANESGARAIARLMSR